MQKWWRLRQTTNEHVLNGFQMKLYIQNWWMKQKNSRLNSTNSRLPGNWIRIPTNDIAWNQKRLLRHIHMMNVHSFQFELGYFFLKLETPFYKFTARWQRMIRYVFVQMNPIWFTLYKLKFAWLMNELQALKTDLIMMCMVCFRFIWLTQYYNWIILVQIVAKFVIIFDEFWSKTGSTGSVNWNKAVSKTWFEFNQTVLINLVNGEW